MKRHSVVFLIFVILWQTGTWPCFAQEIDEASNWYREIGRYDDYLSRFDFRKYTKRDVERAKAKYLRITYEKPADEWEGSYTQGTVLGSAEIIWNNNEGFVYHYVYHMLASLDYGRVSVNAHSVRFKSERNSSRGGKRFFEIVYVKVKFGEKHLLVPKAKLANFALIAAGLDVQRDIGDTVEDNYFWVKVEDEAKRIADVPTYPKPFGYLVRSPICAKVLAVGRLRKKREKSKEWGTTSEEHWRFLTLSSGSRSGIKVGMTFWIDALEERVDVVSVGPTRSVTKLTRPFIDGEEYCSNYEVSKVNEFPCRPPKVGMLARTRTQYF